MVSEVLHPRVELKKKREGGEEEDGIIDPDYAHSISPSERESFGPNGPIQQPLAWGKTALRRSQDAGTFLQKHSTCEQQHTNQKAGLVHKGKDK